MRCSLEGRCSGWRRKARCRRKGAFEGAAEGVSHGPCAKGFRLGLGFGGALRAFTRDPPVVLPGLHVVGADGLMDALVVGGLPCRAGTHQRGRDMVRSATLVDLVPGAIPVFLPSAVRGAAEHGTLVDEDAFSEIGCGGAGDAVNAERAGMVTGLRA